MADIRDQDGPEEGPTDSNRKRKSPRLASKMTSKMSGGYPGQNILGEDEDAPRIIERTAMAYGLGS